MAFVYLCNMYPSAIAPMQKVWTYKPLPPQEKIQSLSAQINVSYPVATLLLQRGIEDYAQAKAFFRPSLDELHDPFLMKNMDKAVSRLIKALEKREKIMIYGDYDVDGTTSVALVYHFLRRLPFDIELEFYIPHRHTEGYGISMRGIEWASQQGVSLIISLDCGIKSTSLVELASQLGIDFIICDHHLPDEEIPGAVAVLDAKQADCQYPFKELSGCGVGFKLMQALCLEMKLPMDGLYELIDLVALSIAADIVPIYGENRVLTYHGIKRLNKIPRPGLKALKDVAGLSEKEINIGNIVFGFAPRINAAGRIDKADLSVRLMLSENEEIAKDFALKLQKLNIDRQGHDSSITQQALEMIESDEFLRNARSTVLFHDKWHKGVIGIVASRVIERYYRPTIILTQSNGKATGSARSIAGFDVHKAILQCADLLDSFGGHHHAAGLSLKLDKIEAFRKRFEEVVSAMMTEELIAPKLEIDLKLNLIQINAKMTGLIREMAPFGPGNLEPLMASEGIQCVTPPVEVKGKTLKMRVAQFNSPVYEAVGFGMADFLPLVQSGQPFKICYHIQENEFRGEKNLQLVIKDIQAQD
jgi:single-stranded-DNA-specific exonuclease